MWPDIFFLCRVRGMLSRLVLCACVAAALVFGSVSLCGGNAAHAEVAKTQEHAAAMTTPPLPVTTVLPIRRTVQRHRQRWPPDVPLASCPLRPDRWKRLYVSTRC